jgi:hypothetical protein
MDDGKTDAVTGRQVREMFTDANRSRHEGSSKVGTSRHKKSPMVEEECDVGRMVVE